MLASTPITAAKRNRESRSVEAAAQVLRQAVGQASTSLTLQEGLYRAYATRLCDLETDLRYLPHGLKAAIHEVVADLRTAFGFDERTRTKVAPSTLDQRRAELLLARLEAIASSAEAVTTAARSGALS
jgi:hypothetical protein